MKRFIRGIISTSIWAATVGAVIGYLATDWSMDYPGEILVGSIFIGLVLGAAGYVVYRALKWVYSEDEVTPAPPRPRAMPTESRYKLAPRDVRAIRASDASVADLAVVYDVSENHITAIKQRKRWRSVR